MAIVEEGVIFPLKAVLERANGTLEGLAEQQVGGTLELPAEVGHATAVVRACAGGDSWHNNRDVLVPSTRCTSSCTIHTARR